MRFTTQAGLTLMEVVVTVAILGILAAIGTPMLLSNISAARAVDAQNTLKSIYLMQKNYYAENYCYLVTAGKGDYTSVINQVLFSSANPGSGPIKTGLANDFYFYILPGTVGSTGSCTGQNSNDYTVYAQSRSNMNVVYSIDQQNIKAGF